MKKVGQLVMPRLDFNDPGYLKQAKRLVADYNVCGFIIFNGSIEEVKYAVSELQSVADYTLLFGCDAERGLGQIVSGGTLFPFLMSQGAANDPELLRKQAGITASEMKYCGLNLVFAPVLDINTNTDNPIINIRSFGDDKNLVAKLGLQFINTLGEFGVISCAKHFPGHGDCDVDSHIKLPVVRKGIDELYENELVPFRESVNSHLNAIMLAHVNYSEYDGNNIPATFSERVIKGLLREKLGYEGVVISDSFRMGALREFGTENQTALRSIMAGCNVILDPFDPVSVLEYLSENYETDREFRDITDNNPVVISNLINTVTAGTKYHTDFSDDEKKRVVSQICERSICRFGGDTLNSNNAEIIIVDIADIGRSVADVFLTGIKNSGINVTDLQYLNPKVSSGSLHKTEDTGIAIILVYTSVRAWQQYTVIPETLVHLLNDQIKNKSQKVLITFGSPYVSRYFEDVDIKLLSFDTLNECQAAAVKLLAGELGVNGKMPVEL